MFTECLNVLQIQPDLTFTVMSVINCPSLCLSLKSHNASNPPFYFEIRYFVFVQKKHMLAHPMLYVNSGHDECKYGVLQFIAKATNSFQTILCSCAIHHGKYCCVCVTQ